MGGTKSSTPLMPEEFRFCKGGVFLPVRRFSKPRLKGVLSEKANACLWQVPQDTELLIDICRSRKKYTRPRVATELKSVGTLAAGSLLQVIVWDFQGCPETPYHRLQARVSFRHLQEKNTTTGRAKARNKIAFFISRTLGS